MQKDFFIDIASFCGARRDTFYVEPQLQNKQKPNEMKQGNTDAGLLHAESFNPLRSVLQEIAENNSISELITEQQISSQNLSAKTAAIAPIKGCLPNYF